MSTASWVNAPHELDLSDGLQLVRDAQLPGVKIVVIDENDLKKHCAERGLGPDTAPMRLQPKSAIVLYKGEGDVLKAWVDKLLK